MKKAGRGRSGGRKIALSVAILSLMTVLIFAGIFLYGRIDIGVNKGLIGYCMQGDTLSVSWQSGSGGDRYRFSRYDQEAGEYVLCGEYAGNSAEFAGVEQNRELKLQMQKIRNVDLFGHNWEIKGRPRVLTVVPVELDSPVLTKTADTAGKSVKVTWDTEPGNSYEIYLANEEGSLELYAAQEEGEITFSPENCERLADREQALVMAVRTVQYADEYRSYGTMSDPVVIKRADLMDSDVHLECVDRGERQYTLQWQEGKGAWYEVQEWSSEEKEWVCREVLGWADELSYDTGRLPSCTEISFRVVTYNDTELRDRGIFETEPSEVSFRTELSSRYCTVWPLKALDFSEDVSGKNVTGQVPAGAALCVLEEAEGRFLVRYQDEYGYIDSNYCMIDLAEYLGNLCEYNITNSYSSIFRVHEYDIPEITENVIEGYENVQAEDGDMLVPYLYPCAQKLYQAALRAREDGYILRIYDAFRPNEATRYLYDTVEVLLDRAVPEKGEDAEETGNKDKEKSQETSGRAEGFAEPEIHEGLTEETSAVFDLLSVDSIRLLKGMSMEGLSAFYVLRQELLLDTTLLLTPENLEESEAAAAVWLTPENILTLQTVPPEEILCLKGLSQEDLILLKVYLDNIVTYREVMTDGRFRLGSFLAQAVSTHNRGIALDLTLVEASSDEEMEMQSEMHDLSWYSILAQNNENADLLASYMKGAGYNGLSSEWWHFQDDEVRNRYNINMYLEQGVSPEGWKKDDLGWRYRLADGSYYCADTVMIDKKECSFDAEGYLIEE